MRVTIDLMKKSTQIIDLTNIINPRVGDDDLLLPLHVGYGDNLYDMRGKDVEFLSQDTSKEDIYIAGTTNTNTPGDNLYLGDLTFRFPAGTFKTDGTYDPDKTMFRIVDKATQKVISSVNVKITVMKNAIEFNFDPDKSSYDSRLETMLHDFNDKGQAMLDEIKDLNNQAKSNVSGDTAATANSAKKQAGQNASDISGLKGEVAGARGRYADMAGREDAQDTAINQKETMANANANYAALKKKDAQQDAAITQKAGKFELEDKLSQMSLQPEAFETVAALQSAYPNGKAGLFLVTENNHEYVYIDHTWKDCGPFVGAGILDKSVNVNKLSQVLQDSLAPTVEEVPITGQWSGFISIQTGHNADNDNVYYSDAIPVTPGEVYIANGTTYYDGRTVILEDANKNVVGYFPQSLTDKELDSHQTFMFVVPQSAVTLYINTKKGNGNERHLYKVQNFNRVEQATSAFVSAIVNDKQAKYQPVELTKCNSDGYWQYQYGYYMNDATKKTVGYSQVSVKPFETYRIRGNSYYEANLYNLYDFAGRVIESFPNTNSDAQFYDHTFTVPYNGAFLKVNQYKDGPEVVLEKVVEWHDKTPITDKKWVAIGDSWTAPNTLGNGVDNYTDYVADRLGVTMVNAGVGGTGYVAQNSNYGDQFYNRQIPADGDAYTIFGSFNDVFVDGFKFGDAGDTDTKSLWGGMKATLDHIWSIKDDAVVGIIAPGPWGAFNPQNANNWDKLNMKASEVGEQYVATMKKFADYYSLPFLDLYHQSGLRPWDSSFVAKYYHGTSDTDTTHPNTNGHKIFASKIADFVNKLL